MLQRPHGDPNAYRPLPNYGDLQRVPAQHVQNYHGLQSLLSRQRGKFNFTLAYTFSKALGIRGDAPAARGIGLGVHPVAVPRATTTASWATTARTW